MNKPTIAAIAIAIGFTLVSILVAINEDSDLEVSLLDRITVSITNRGSDPITIQSLQINDRNDCLVRMGIIAYSDFKPQTLKTGDQRFYITSCNVVRATVGTNRGDFQYRFD